jgi:hypothetical protein
MPNFVFARNGGFWSVSRKISMQTQNSVPSFHPKPARSPVTNC